MPDPLRVLPMAERWTCHACGECCKKHTVLLSPADRERLAGQRWEVRPEFAAGVMVRVAGAWALRQRPDGACVFLQADGKCLIHAEHGEPQKPWACRMFPYQVLPHDGQVRVTMRRSCPSAALDKGQPLAEQMGLIRELAPGALPKETLPPPALADRHRRPWPETRRVTDLLEQGLLAQDRPLPWKLAQGSYFVHLLRGAKGAEAMSGPDFRALVDTLAQAASRAAAELFKARPEPGRVAKLYFRQTAGEYLREPPPPQARQPWRDKWQAARAAWKLSRGHGEAPRLQAEFPAARFTDLERPLGALSAEVLRPFDRFFAANVASLQYCGAGRQGWSVADGFQALALAYAAGLWALRWLALGRTPTVADAGAVVTHLDRGHYSAPLMSGRHRRRVRTLADLGDLEALLAWMAR